MTTASTSPPGRGRRPRRLRRGPRLASLWPHAQPGAGSAGGVGKTIATAAIAGLLEGELALAKEDSDPPRLELTATNGSRLSFTGAPTADTRFGGPGERMFLEVAPQRVECHHPLIADMQCLRVREVSFDGDGLRSGEPGEWQVLYEGIEGFEHQPGVRNVLRVYRYTRDPVPADASSIVYVHDMTVESALE